MMKIRWWQWLPFQPWRLLGYAEAADEIPARLPQKGAVAVGAPSFAKWVAFDCPCKTGHRIMLNLDMSRHPAWQMEADHPERLTIRPSVDYTDGRRRCHYFVDKGEIRWSGDSTR